jgi:hypothetical protein
MMDEEDKELEKDTASHEGINDEDLQETREKVKDLRRLLNQIQSTHGVDLRFMPRPTNTPIRAWS